MNILLNCHSCESPPKHSGGLLRPPECFGGKKINYIAGNYFESISYLCNKGHTRNCFCGFFNTFFLCPNRSFPCSRSCRFFSRDSISSGLYTKQKIIELSSLRSQLVNWSSRELVEWLSRKLVEWLTTRLFPHSTTRLI